MIKRTTHGKYILFSADGGRRLSKPGTLAQIRKREQQIRFFKNRDKARKP